MSYEDNNPFGGSGNRPAFLNQSTEDDLDGELNADEPAPFTTHEHHVPVFPKPTRVSSNFVGRCHRQDQIPDYLESGGTISVVDAGKNNEGSGGSFISYTIRTGEMEVRRRYSEFESLRSSLARLYPCLIVPPIPVKQSITDYSAGTAKAREDQAIIEHRKRMLEQFLRRTAAHKTLRLENIFHRFLDSNVSWSEVLISPPLSHLPKNILKAPPNNPASAHEDLSYLNLPIPAHTSKASKTATDPVSTRLLQVEKLSKEFEAILSTTLEKTNRRILKRFNDLSTDYNELGANYNAFSLSEAPQVAGSIEKLGQASDETYLAMANLAYNLSNAFTEPLGEQTQMLNIVRQVLKYRRQKMTQVEQASELLHHKRESLENLERSELEARRIDGVLNRMGDTPANEFPPTHDPQPAPSSPSKSKTSIGGFKFGLDKLNHAIHSLTDTDPALSRRNRIGSTKELIGSLEVAAGNSECDLKYIDETISKEIADWEDGRRRDWRQLTASVSTSYVEWAKKCLETWEEAERTISEIPAHEFF